MDKGPAIARENHCPGDPMSDKKNKVSRRPKTATTKVETVVHRQMPKSQPRRRSAAPSRSFQQPNPRKPSASSLRVNTRRSGDVAVIPGDDLVASISVSDEKKVSAGDVLISLVLNPESMGLPRLAALSKLYKRWRIKQMEFYYEPTATIQPGSLLGYVDYDSFDDPTDGTPTQRLQRARATYGEKGVNITNRGSWKVLPMKEDLYIHSDLITNSSHWHQYGRFVLYANSDIAVGVACGTVCVRYVVEFLHPSYEIPPTSFDPIQGYRWIDTWDYPEGKITSTEVDPMSFLPGISVTTQLYSNARTITLPYSNSTDNQNWYLFTCSCNSTEILTWTLTSPVGIVGHSAMLGTYFASTSNRPTMSMVVHVTAELNSFILATPGPGKDCMSEFIITRCRPVSILVKPRAAREEGDTKESKDMKVSGIEQPSGQKSTIVPDLTRVPLQRSGTSAPPTTPIGSGSSSSLSSATVSSGWFRV